MQIATFVPNPETRTQLVRKWLALYNERKRLEDQLDELKRRAAQVESDVKEAFLNDNIDRDSVDGMTVHILRQIQISVKDKNVEAANAMLQELGMGHVIKSEANPSTLKSIIKDLESAAERGDAQAAWRYEKITSVYNVYELFKLSARKAGRSESGEKFLRGTGDDIEGEN